ncbi:hypothetical protein [Thermococcus sp.]|uniref:hypothetical protein n=1 Tax=Thermococcus sp. TaxID=35749 RepID=UPI0026330D5B|nr:hypothetical protein [Thermococcus sp.]
MRFKELVQDYVNGVVLWALLGIILKDHVGKVSLAVPFLLAIGSPAKRFGEPRGYLLKALAFLSSSALLPLGEGWLSSVLAVTFLLVGVAYAFSYPLYHRGNNFLPRNMLGVAVAGFVLGAGLFLRISSVNMMRLLDLLLAVALLWIAISIGEYISIRYRSNKVISDFWPVEIKRVDFSLVEVRRTISRFVEDADPAPLIVQLLRRVPRSVSDADLEELVRMLTEYRPYTGGPLTPPWLRTLYAEKEKEKRANLVREVLGLLSGW